MVNGRRGEPTNVLIRGNTIAAIGSSANAVATAQSIDGQGGTLMPGLIDAHVHLTFGAVLLKDLYDPNTTPEQLAAAASKSAKEMLLRGFTAVRDMGGPIFPLKHAIDSGKIQGPRIWPSGAIISQTSGHGDFRTPEERSRRFFGKRFQAIRASLLASAIATSFGGLRSMSRSSHGQHRLFPRHQSKFFWRW